MPLTPTDVHNIAFSKPPIGKRGCHEDEVDAFLDLVQAELTRLPAEHSLRTPDAIFVSSRRPSEGLAHRAVWPIGGSVLLLLFAASVHARSPLGFEGVRGVRGVAPDPGDLISVGPGRANGDY